MITAFQPNAFQSSPLAFQISTTPVIVVTDYGDADRKRKKRWEAEAEARRRKKHEVLAAYERLVEGKSDEVAELVAPYVEQPKPRKGVERPPVINFDKMLADVERIDRLWEAYIAMDDEDILRIMGML